MDTHNKSLKSVKSKLQMAKTDVAIGETDLKDGELNYRPGRTETEIYVRINWMTPVKEELAVANGQYVLHRPSIKQAIVGKVDSVKGKNSKAGGVLAFMSMTKAQLAANYEVKYIGEETVKSGANTWHLLLTPKNPTCYKSAVLWVDANGLPVQARIVEKNNDTTTLLLSNIQKNVTIKGSQFKISPPKGTAIIKG
jgi:outer membrane lipoprotein-sorting protein